MQNSPTVKPDHRVVRIAVIAVEGSLLFRYRHQGKPNQRCRFHGKAVGGSRVDIGCGPPVPEAGDCDHSAKRTGISSMPCHFAGTGHKKLFDVGFGFHRRRESQDSSARQDFLKLGWRNQTSRFDRRRDCPYAANFGASRDFARAVGPCPPGVVHAFMAQLSHLRLSEEFFPKGQGDDSALRAARPQHRLVIPPSRSVGHNSGLH